MSKIIIAFFCFKENALWMDNAEALKTENYDFKIISVLYENAADLVGKWRKHQMIIHGALFDCEASYLWVRQNFKFLSIPTMKVEPSEADILKAIISLSHSSNSLQNCRLLIDADHNKSLESTFSVENRPVFLNKLEWAEVPVNTWEDNMIRRYQMAFESACYDLLLTKHANLLPRLDALNIPSQAIIPAVSTFLTILCLLLLKAYQKTQGRCLFAYGIVGIKGGTMATEKLYQSIERFNTEHEYKILLTRRSGVCELAMSNQMLHQLTKGYNLCVLTEHLKSMFTDFVCTGWGIGSTVIDARLYAIRAYRESLFETGHQSYLINQDGILIGPLLGRNETIIPDENRKNSIESASVQTGMSTATLKKMSEVLDIIGRLDVTSESLATNMGLTQRSASRILLKLEENKLAVLTEAPNQSKTGRPKKHYSIFLI